MFSRITVRCTFLLVAALLCSGAGLHAENLSIELITFTTSTNNRVSVKRVFPLNSKLRIRLQISGLKATAGSQYHIQADVKVTSEGETVIDGKNIINRKYPTEDLDTLITFFNLKLSSAKFKRGKLYQLLITVRDLHGKQSHTFTSSFKIR